MKLNICYISILLLIVLLPLHTVAQKKKSRNDTKAIVTRVSGSNSQQKVLYGRHIALWNSHGWYYNQIKGEWRWQRARLLGTIEDLHTTDYVMTYLAPMLENAGAYVFIPRERDFNLDEYIVDNDSEDTLYRESGSWANGKECGFAQRHTVYTDGMNPFTEGSYRYIKSVAGEPTALATWHIPIERNGNYAVYIAYHSEKNSSEDALYSVHHAGGSTQYIVNQTMGGGTWIYLGSFDFEAGGDNRVVLTNKSSKKGSIITADAIKVGGGMGNIARMPCMSPRKPTKEALNNYLAAKKEAARNKKRKKKKAPEKAQGITEPTVSGMPRYAEAARYWMQWAGIPDTIYSDTGGDNDYNDDLRGRGYWVNYLCGGSQVLPDSVGLNIPIDMAFAFHSDAGNEPADSIVGTMNIYYTGKKRERFYADGTARLQSKRLSDNILKMIEQDIRRQINRHWTIREDRDRRYAEARLGQVPSVLFESMSHQSFPDMRYGLDPRFKFILSRAVYKGILKYLSSRNGTPYIVQPLPVNHMALKWEGNTHISINWQMVTDSLEPSATPTHYKVYTRKGEYGWDNGVVVDKCQYICPIDNDITYSFYVTALNAGGESFPSEILSACRVNNATETVMIVNAFDRISSPLAFEDSTRTIAGFRYDIDGGVPYKHTIAYTGEQYEFNRLAEWEDDDINPGFGASHRNYEGQRIAGNTFDYPYVHGTAIAQLGYSFLSASEEALCSKIIDPRQYPYIDIIFGKERATILGNDSTHYDFACMTPELTDILTGYCLSGGRLLMSGAYIGSDTWQGPRANSAAQTFATDILHLQWKTTRSAHGQAVAFHHTDAEYANPLSWDSHPNGRCYAVEECDVIAPVGSKAQSLYMYNDKSSAAVAFDSGLYRCCTLGFPIEAITEPKHRYDIMKQIFDFLQHKP